MSPPGRRRHLPRERPTERLDETSPRLPVAHDEDGVSPGDGHFTIAALRRDPDRENHVGSALDPAVEECPFPALGVIRRLLGRLPALVDGRDLEGQMAWLVIALAAPDLD